MIFFEVIVSKKEKQTQMILSENLWKVMWNISLPAVIAMILYGLNSVFDAIFVGRFVGESALAGVTIAQPFQIYHDKKMIKEILSMGMPSLIMTVMSFIQAIVVFGALSKYRTTYDLAFYPAINKSKPAAIIGIARQLIFYVPVMIFLPKFYGVEWVYYGSLLIDCVITLWVFILIKKEFSILRKVHRGEIEKSVIPDAVATS